MYEKGLDKNNLNTKANGPLYEMFNQNESNQLLTDFSKILVSKTENETVDFIKDSKGFVISGMLGNLTSNAMGSNKMWFYLSNKIIKVVADEYYQIQMKFTFGGEKDYYDSMNQQKGMPSLKLKIKVYTNAPDKKGNEIWVKEKEVKDFSGAFNLSYII